jgi:hypothetical protein
MADWFDGFQTLKFVHYMRDTYYPSRSLTEVCDGSILPDRQIHDIDAVRALHQHLYDKLDEALDAISE